MPESPSTQPQGGPRYIMRIDDICPTMDWVVFNRFEAVMDRQGVKPIVAVIPDNQDPTFHIHPPASDFWARVRGWQAKGWTIGLHGYQHRYVSREPGILGLSPKSEFTGLPYAAQLEKLQQAVGIFSRHGVTVDAWVAPSHAFDWTTVAALNALGIRAISDGLALQPYRDHLGNTWVPQQFALMRAMPWGTWTFCYHVDDFDSEAFWESFERQLADLGPRMTTFSEALSRGNRSRSLADRSVQFARHAFNRTRRLFASQAGE
jgi:predicted deacetylase